MAFSNRPILFLPGCVPELDAVVFAIEFPVDVHEIHPYCRYGITHELSLRYIIENCSLSDTATAYN